MALVEDEERDPYMLEFTKSAIHLNVFKSFGHKSLPENPKPATKSFTQPDPPPTNLKEPEPEDFEAPSSVDSIDEASLDQLPIEPKVSMPVQ